MSKKYTLYVVPHTHWDREWYASFQFFRLRLVRLINKLLALLAHDPNYATFNLDGQTVTLEDYLEVHPEQRETLQHYIQTGRIKVGPWYVLPDEFLTSGESMVHNLLLGGQIARTFGHRMEVGYIPDTFGHIGQLPQIFRGFGLDTAMHFRGFDPGQLPSELWWEAPDGSRVLLHHMSNVIGYSDSGALAQDQQWAANDLKAVAYYKAERATTNVLLAMQGVDHLEVREDLPAILNIANDTVDDVEFVHASLEDFWAALKAATAKVDLQTIYGELRDVPRSSEGVNYLLYNVLSSRADNKLQNAKALVALENWAEPWAALAWTQHIADYPQGHLWTAWRWLLKNHPHDSIGGCSIDAVHRQMATRFEWATEIADYLTEERFQMVAQDLDLSTIRDDEYGVVLFNATPWDRDEVVTVDIDLPEYWLRQCALAAMPQRNPVTPDTPYLEMLPHRTQENWLHGLPDMPEVFFRGIHVRPVDGDPVPVQIESITETPAAQAVAFGPGGVMDVRRVRASFRAQIPAYGYASYAVSTDSKPVRWPAPDMLPHVMQNEHLQVVVNPNGTFNLTCHAMNQTFTNLGFFDDSGDNGDGYTFSPPPFNQTYTTQSAAPRIAKIGRGVGVQRIRIMVDLELPGGLNETRSERRAETIISPLQIDLILRDGSPRLEIEVTLDNHAKDHRLRMLFPIGLVEVQEAASAMQFDVMTRPIKPEPIPVGDWWVEDPPETFPMHGWVDLQDNGRGLCVIAQGVHEFAIENAQDRAVALTLLRAVGYLGARRDTTTIIGGAGPGLPTPEAQLQTRLTYRLALYPHENTWDVDQVWRQCAEFLTPPRTVSVSGHEGSRPALDSWLRVDGRNAVLSSVKRAEDGEALVVRLFNPALEATTAMITLPTMPNAVTLANLDEKPLAALQPDPNGGVSVELPPKKIVTLRIQ